MFTNFYENVSIELQILSGYVALDIFCW